MSGARCIGKWWLFDSTNPGDHLEARELCAACPMRRECQETADRFQRGPGGMSVLEGTWGGRLYGSTARARMRDEETMFTQDEARAAHAAWERADPQDRNRSGVGDRIVIGERVYQRRARRRRASKRVAA